MERKYIILALIAAFVVALDQLTKIYIHTRFGLGDSVMVIPGYFNITYVRNLGGAFGFLGDSHEVLRKVFFLSIPPLAMLIILFILRGTPSSDRWQIFALSGIFGGAIGNYLDRLRFGYVVDFLDFHWRNKYTWPAFNIADSAIVCGMAILILIMVRDWRQESSSARASGS